MCGIVGLLNQKNSYSTSELKEIMSKMASTLQSRGPDNTDTWNNAKKGIALGHTRLSIIDLSTEGNQPIHSSNKRFSLSYNGEIYNFPEIRQDLESKGINFKGHADSEVLVEACNVYGIKETIAKLIGMFAFAIWDNKEETLTLVRDRLGIKPLYWGRVGGDILFASQSKAFSKHPKWQPQINEEALAYYFRFGYIPHPYSIYNDIQQLTPGHLITINKDLQTKEESYWQLNYTTTSLSETEATEQLEHLLNDAIKKRMISDVPIGAFLSGGVDSSLITAIMQQQSSRPIKTFTVGFHNSNFDESPHARKIAEHLGTDHTELHVTPQDMQDLIPSIPDAYDEPFADSSQVPTMLISKLIRNHVTVALSGDGGDEIFAGYNRYIFANKLKQLFSTPHTIRALTAGIITSVAPNIWDKIIPGQSISGDKIHKLASVLKLKHFHDIYPHLTSQWQDTKLPLSNDTIQNLSSKDHFQTNIDNIHSMQIADIHNYLPDDILTKVDRASMAYGLEARVPLLDHRIVEFGMSLPLKYSLDKGVSKKILRNILYKHIPKKLIERPKMGFAIPLADWLRGDLRDWAEDLLSEDKIAKSGLLDAKPIRQKWQEHQKGSRNWQYALWPVLMFQAWQQKWL